MHISCSWTGKSSDAYQYALFIDNLFTGNSSEVLRHQLRLRQVNVGVNSNGDFRFFGDIVPVGLGNRCKITTIGSHLI